MEPLTIVKFVLVEIVLKVDVLLVPAINALKSNDIFTDHKRSWRQTIYPSLSGK